MKPYYSSRSLYVPCGQRKYVNKAERKAIAAALSKFPASEQLFVQAFLWTGARVSEVLSITPESCQLEACVLAVTTLKRRQFVVREIPVPQTFMRNMNRHFRLRAKQRDACLSSVPVWQFHRCTGWRLIKAVMVRAGISGVRASPRGLRHSFGVTAVTKGIPLNVVQKLLGHASIKSTAIYTEATGPDRGRLFRVFGGRSGETCTRVG